MGKIKNHVPTGLYAITDSLLTPPENLVTSVEAAIQGGAVMIQYREKSAPMAERLALARSLQSVCATTDIPLLINDDIELAKRIGAAGVHLGQKDGTAAEARQYLGDQAIIGITCHADLSLAETATLQGADYLAFGRFFSSSTKPEAPSAPTDILAKAKCFNRPITAIGGVTTENGALLIEAGADLLAVVGGLFGGNSLAIEQKANIFKRLFNNHHPFYSTPR